MPLFRQAIVLANVRAAVAGLPAQPKAEFQRGLLTLTFPRGTQPEVATAINRTLAASDGPIRSLVPFAETPDGGAGWGAGLGNPLSTGPRYLHRFTHERTLSVDTTASGGNASLLSLDEDQG